MNHLSYDSTAWYSITNSIYASSSFFQFHTDQLQNIFHQYDLPLCTLCKIQSSDSSKRNAILFDHVFHKGDSLHTLHLRNLNLLILLPFRLFHREY